MLRYLRPLLARLLLPVGRFLARLGVTPSMVTLLGALGTVASALVFYPQGELFTGSAVITAFVLFDMLDGAVARASDSASKWGAFLDSTLDRLSDAAILSGLVVWFLGGGRDPVLGYLALFCLVSGFGVSYIKARAEGLGANCDVGIAERSERLVIILVAVGLGGLGVPYVLEAGLGVLALLSAITVVQRLIETRNRLTRPRRPAGDPETA
ncbi:phosphatidylinositol phosphate synthase [Streptomonospora nanhaiensis]|uniref:Phosphatidylinositol phosphate synthase n=1 Tax=Streptomonospora nanhaiensis TaxID=1323731 RepID=A0A853BV02_9ACTN|nr:CDP-alcohol phosphatidyltransferase family protein [Streptomonospora nanhaiensis]MBV2364856.1 CDP-alcohol phosphatidyltransferase family protein [Streptomonospora nanhaiensis]MBX9387176.1 CDP-alcohol phosphatidyltransferase family protein [Streptomonospora nanhaiensis]NYI98800.1 CDP-diacylglycerol--glycerol-3-phosphate 3-phosphatidyltransferase [Streptomonospora nanhaiensis]